MLVAGPNLTIDRALTIDELRPGEVLRFARVPALLVGFVPGRTGEAVARLLADEGLALRAVLVRSSEIRSAALILERSGRTTVLNEPGPTIAAADWEAYEGAVAETLEDRRILVCSGSTPPGSPRDAYGRLVCRARKRGLPSLVDAAGATLEEALGACPDFVTPNLAEADGVLRGQAPERVELALPEAMERSLAAAAELVARGAGCAVVTVGSAGAAVVEGSRRGWVAAPRVRVRNPVGAGDSFVAGFAAAAASVESDVPAGLDPDRVRELAHQISFRCS